MDEKKINYTGFWTGFDPEDNLFTDILRKHFSVTISDDPDYLFCSVFSRGYVYNEKAIRIFYTGEYQVADFNMVDYAMGFDYMTFGDRYCRVPHYLLYKSDLLKRASERGGIMDDPEYRDNFCSFVYSNVKADPVREEFFRKLNARKHVDSAGGFLNNMGYRATDKVRFESKYRFSIAFENSSYPGYITEKIIQAIAAGTIPIYYGDTEADKLMNPKAYININRFENMDEAIELILDIDNDRDRFMGMLREYPFIRRDILDEQKKECEEFLMHIFGQPIENAFRRNNTMWGKSYEVFFKRYAKMDETMRRTRNLFGKK